MRIDCFLFGAYRIKVNEEDIARAATAFLKARLTAKIAPDGSMVISAAAAKKYISALGGIPYSKSEILGLPGLILKNRKRYGIYAALILLSVFYVFVNSFVWDIRIEGNENLSSSKIEEELYDAGLFVGTKWRSLSRDKVEEELLSSSENIGWLNINRRGNVAYVTVKERYTKEENAPSVPSNIVSEFDCVIEEITVKSGVAAVKVGDTVFRGQLLISGVLPKEMGGGFVEADGEVLGRVSEVISTEVTRRETLKVYDSEILDEVYVNIFNFSIKIFEKYRKSLKECVIIEDNTRCVAFGKRLPLGLSKIYKREIVDKTVVRSDDELIAIAAGRHLADRVIRLSDSELLKMSTSGEFTEDGYIMRSVVSVLRDVGGKRSFE